MQRSEISVGDILECTAPKFPGQWRVMKINPKNIKLENTVTGKGLNAHPSFLRPASSTTFENNDDLLKRLEHAAQFTLGSLVTLDGHEGYFVVTKVSSDKLNVAQLGGDNGRYWRVTPTHLQLVMNWTVGVRNAVDA